MSESFSQAAKYSIGVSQSDSASDVAAEGAPIPVP
jgi:hypothetical protein